MSTFHKWSDIRPGMVESLGGEESLEDARQQTQAYIDGYRLVERRRSLGMTQTDVADRMGVSKSRISQIERGEVSTFNVIARCVDALGGQIQVSAVFGDDHYILRGTGASAA